MSDDVQGVEELVRQLNALEIGADEALGEALDAGAHVYEGFVKTSMNKTKHGRTYRRGQKSHTASAPGEAPAIDYGLVLNSIGTERDGTDAVIYTSAEVSPHLEFGTARMRARPFMRPPMDEHKNEIMAAVQKTLTRKIEEQATK